jgi:hypothetical protein
MTNWVYPLGTATDGKWDVSIGTSDSSLTVEGWEHTGLKVATLAAGADVVLPAADEERIVVPLNGSFTATVDGTGLPLAGPRLGVPRPQRRPVLGNRTCRDHQLGRRRPGCCCHGARQCLVPHPPGDRRRNAGGAAGGRQLLPPGPQLRHSRRAGSGPVHRLRSPHPRRQLVLLPPAQARRGEGRRDPPRGDLLLRNPGGSRFRGTRRRRRHRLPARLRL